LSDKDKLAFETNRIEMNVKRENYDRSVRDLANYDDMEKCDIDCKIAFEEELLAWKVATFEACMENNKSIECRENEQIKLENEQARAEINYYTLNTDERKEFD